MNKLYALWGATALWSSVSIAQTTIAEDAAAFGVRESVQGADLSPDGKKVVYIEPSGAAGSIVYIADIASGKTTPFLKSGGGASEQLQWCAFVTDTRLVCRYTGIGKLDGQLVPFSRLLAINSDGSNQKELGQKASWDDSRIRQFDGRIIDWLPGGDGSVLMARDYVSEVNQTGSRLGRSKEGLAVDRINTSTLKVEEIEKARRDVREYLSDGRGNVRVMVVPETSAGGLLTGRTRIDFRGANSRKWETLSGFDDKLQPLAIDATTDSLYALKKLDGRYALYRYNLAGSPKAELVASHPRVDIDEVIRSAHGQRVIGYGFVEDKRQTVYFDPERKALAAALHKAIPGLPLIQFIGASQDLSKSLIFAGSDSDPGRYYVYDHGAKQLNELFIARPQLEKRQIAKVKPVSVRVADGTIVPAYLTLPPGVEPRGLPAVVLPHGGPSSRDEWGFDWLAQYLAARGYAVIQPNYRGSAGFGDHWLMDNGFKSWRTSVGDIVGSIRWLVSEGIADPNRLAAVGWSYGGYAALQAAATEPNLFKAVAAIAPVTDLQLLKTESEGYTNSKLVAEFVGSGPHIDEGSPLRHASAIKAPVLLAHGDMDLNVGVAQSLKMESALKSAGTPVQLLRFEGLDHHLEDSGARRDLLVKIGQLLDRTIGQK